MVNNELARVNQRLAHSERVQAQRESRRGARYQKAWSRPLGVLIQSPGTPPDLKSLVHGVLLP
jgi:hypothetical protein